MPLLNINVSRDFIFDFVAVIIHMPRNILVFMAQMVSWDLKKTKRPSVFFCSYFWGGAIQETFRDLAECKLFAAFTCRDSSWWCCHCVRASCLGNCIRTVSVTFRWWTRPRKYVMSEFRMISAVWQLPLFLHTYVEMCLKTVKKYNFD